jgi:hypothetical protein
VSTHKIEVVIEGGNDVTIVTLSGLADPAGIHALLTELDGLAQQGAALRLLLDETDLRAGLMGLSDIQDIVGDWRKANALKSRRIAVVATNPLIRGLNQMFRIFANVENKGSVSSFSNRTSALAWLARPLN